MDTPTSESNVGLALTDDERALPGPIAQACEPTTGGRGRMRLVSCPYCGRNNRCYVSGYRWYYYSCWYCGDVFRV